MATLPVGPHRIEEMMRVCLEQAKQMLAKNGAFYPFGAAIDAEGNQRPVTGDAGPDAKTSAVYQVIRKGLREQFFKREIVAGAIVAEATIPPELKPDFPEGLRISVESESISRLVFLPYQKVRREGEPVPAADEPAPIGPANFHFGVLLGINVRPTIFVQEPLT